MTEFHFLYVVLFMVDLQNILCIDLAANKWQAVIEPIVSQLSDAYMRHIRSIRGHDDVIKWKHFPRYWPFVRGIQRSPVNSPHKGQWRGALMFSLICVWINGWVNNREAGDLRRNRAHYDVTVMCRRQRWSASKSESRFLHAHSRPGIGSSAVGGCLCFSNRNLNSQSGSYRT